MDHERVFVRMDGSTRLTTRNRIFVKKIISPQELPDQNVMQDPSVPVMLGASNDEDTNAQGHIEDTDGMGDHSSVQQQGMGILADQSLYCHTQSQLGISTLLKS